MSLGITPQNVGPPEYQIKQMGGIIGIYYSSKKRKGKEGSSDLSVSYSHQNSVIETSKASQGS